MIDIYAFVACVILAVLSLFQLALVLGAPIGKFAWGGQHTVLPKKLRVGSVIAIVIYAIFAIFILDKAGITNIIDNEAVVNTGVWIFTAYFFLGVIMNAISRSKPERIVMTPVALILAILFLLVARG